MRLKSALVSQGKIHHGKTIINIVKVPSIKFGKVQVGEDDSSSEPANSYRKFKKSGRRYGDYHHKDKIRESFARSHRINVRDHKKCPPVFQNSVRNAL